MSSPASDAGRARSRQHSTAAPAPRGGMYPDVEILPNWKREVAAHSGWIVALCVGVLAVLAVRLVQYHFTGAALVTDTPVLTTAVEAGGGVVLSFLAFLLFPYRGLKYVLLLLVGVAASTVAMHNAIHAQPGLFSLIFSPDWTAAVVEATEPNSLLVLDTVIPLTLPEEEEKVLPTVLRLN